MLDLLKSWVGAAGAWSVAALGGAAFLEYLFPPFPGDTVLLLGASLAAIGLIPWWTVLPAVVVGSMGGCAVDYFLGRWLGRKAEERADRPAHLRFFTKERIHRFEAAYRRHGRLYILVNRFIPGVRAFFFVLAGASGMPFGEVMVFGTLSAAAWCGLILAGGYALGRNAEELQGLYREYTIAVWVALGIVAAGGLLRFAWRARRG